MNYKSEISAALDIAKNAGDLQLQFQHKLKTIELKEDRSPVTEIDKQCEAMIRDQLLKIFPQDGFLGEETGNHNGTSGRRWIVDPLDGTRPFIRGIPTFSVLIALEDGGIPSLGVIFLPAMSLTCWAFRNGGAFLNDQKIHVSTVERLENSMGSALGFLEKSDYRAGKQLLSLLSKCDYNYGFMDAFSYVCAAAGKIDFAVNLLDKAWDCAAAACIVTEAGGKFSDINGNHSVYNGSFVISNGILHSQVLDFFREPKERQ